MRVRDGEVESTGQAASGDTIEAALRAYLSAVSAAHRLRTTAREAVSA